MKNLFQTIRNIFKIEDLRVRILNTFFFLLIYRLGTHIVLPGVDPQQLDQLRQQNSDLQNENRRLLIANQQATEIERQNNYIVWMLQRDPEAFAARVASAYDHDCGVVRQG